MQPAGTHIPEAQSVAEGGRGMDPGAQEWRTRMSLFMPCGPGCAHYRGRGEGEKGKVGRGREGAAGISLMHRPREVKVWWRHRHLSA